MDSNIEKIIYGAAGFVLGGLVAGYAVYRVTERRAADWYAEVAEDQILAEREYWKSEVEKADKKLDKLEEGLNNTHIVDVDSYVEVLSQLGYSGDPSDVVLLYDRDIPIYQAIKDLGLGQDVKEDPEEETETVELEVEDQKVRNIFRDNEPLRLEEDFQIAEYERFSKDRNPKEPYVIHISEYMAASSTIDAKISLIYYEGDGVLTDETNIPIPDTNRLVGDANLDMFGKFSGDKNIVYIRNERPDVNSDFEILRKPTSFEEAVLGVYSRDPIRRMREEDE